MVQNEFKSFIYNGTTTQLEKGDRINIEARTKDPKVVFRVFRAGNQMLWKTRFGKSDHHELLKLHNNEDYTEWVKRIQSYIKTTLPLRRTDTDFKHYGVIMDFIVG